MGRGVVPCRAEEVKRVSCVVGSGEKRETTKRRATGETWPRGETETLTPRDELPTRCDR